jgi:hypothetical protein
MKCRILPLLLVAGLAPQSQAQDSRPVGPWKVARSTRGDTSVVHTLSGSVWGEKVRLVEELRIGTREGDGPDAFGFIGGFALFSDGVLAVFDQTVPALRLFTPDGKHLRTLGRDGAGPGEYRNQTLGLAVDRDGVLLMYDPRNARINRWKRDGTVLPSWLVASASRLYTDQAMQVDTSGTTYLKVMTEALESGKEWKIGLLRLGRNGVIRDTLSRPPIEGEVDPGGGFFNPQKYWYVARAGEVVTGFGGVYGITVTSGGRGAVRIERALPRVMLAAAERANYQTVLDARSRDPMARPSAPPSPVPAVKPYYRQLQSDLDGRIWARLHTKGEEFEPPAPTPRPGAPAVPPIRWRERVIWDVFERNGTYLGQLELPRRTQLSEAKGDLVWAIQRGEDDEQYLVRFKISGK